MNIQQAGQWALEFYELESAWRWIQAFNEAHTLAYHNTRHLEIVVGAAAWLAHQEGVDAKLPVIAAMFHDMNHTGKQPDSVNIQRALCGLRRARNTIRPNGMPLVDLVGEDFNEVADAIRCTEFTGVEWPYIPQNTTERILRDADLWNPHLEPKQLADQIAGLGIEIGAWTNHNLDVGIVNSLAFFKNVTWYTATAQKLASNVETNLMALLNQYFDDIHS